MHEHVERSRLIQACSIGAVLFSICSGSAAQAQSAISCPERIRTAEATLSSPAQAAGFKPLVGDEMSQSFLQDVAVLGGAGDGVAVKGTAKGPRRIEWSFDGQTAVTVACVFEGGITLARAVGTPKSCAATIKRSRGSADAAGWGMESASFSCR